VITAAGTAPSVAAGTAPALTPAQVTAGEGTAGTQGFAGLSVSAPVTVNNSTDVGTLGAVSIDPTFTLTPTGSITAGTATGLAINTANATATGRTLSIQNDANNTVDSSLGFFGGGQANAYKTTATINSDYEINAYHAAGYTYTQYGDWYHCTANCIGASGTTTEVFGYFSRGEATAPANIPTTGTATYNGFTKGNIVDDSGGYAGTSADMNAAVDFAARSVAFSTINSMIGGTSDSRIDMTGTLTYAAGQNLFAGTVTSGTAGSAMSGTAVGRFNGPAAEEIGGVYSLSGAGGAHLGVFVGK
jgi:hypothetical protein